METIITGSHKDIIISSLSFLNQDRRANIYAFVIMENHFHLICQIMGEHKWEDVQRDFLKFTGQQVLKQLRNSRHELLNAVMVNAKDRKYQVWERNSLSMEHGLSITQSSVTIMNSNKAQY